MASLSAMHADKTCVQEPMAGMSSFHPLTMYNAYAIERTQNKEQWTQMLLPDSMFLPRLPEVRLLQGSSGVLSCALLMGIILRARKCAGQGRPATQLQSPDMS